MAIIQLLDEQLGAASNFKLTDVYWIADATDFLDNRGFDDTNQYSVIATVSDDVSIDLVVDGLGLSVNGERIDDTNKKITTNGKTITINFGTENTSSGTYDIREVIITLYGQTVFSDSFSAPDKRINGDTFYYIIDREGGVGIDAHTPPDNGNCDSRIYVNGVRIPVVNADVHIRKEGSLDVTRYAEVQFPATYEGTRYVEQFRTVEPQTQDRFDTLYVELKDPSGNYVPTFRGYVTGVGATDKSGIWQCRARGPADLLTSVNAGKQFTNSSVDIPLQYVSDQLSDKAPFPVDVVLDTEATEGIGVQQEGSGGNRSLAARLNAQNVDYDVELSNKTFQKNRHTLKDVVDWLRSKTSLRLWFEPTEDGVTLVPFDSPTANSFSAHYLGGSVEVIENNALSELAPINTIEAKGAATKSLLDIGDFELNQSADKFIVAKARHEPLYNRAGNTELQADTFIKSDGNTKQEVQNDAKNALKDAVDEATAGDMTTLLAGGVTPFDTIEARPTCRTEAEKTVPITYEVNRVHHMVSPDDEESGNISKSRLNIGIHTDIEDDMKIIDTWKEKKIKES